jgi:hypothetical protein
MLDAHGDVTKPTPHQRSASSASHLRAGGKLNPLRAHHPMAPGRPSTAQPLSFQGPVGVVRCVSPVELHDIVNRLYSKGLEDKRRHEQLSNTNNLSSSSPPRSPSPGHRAVSPAAQMPRPVSAAPTMTTEEVKESVNRLYYNGIKHKLDAHKKLAEKYLFHCPHPKRQDVSAQELRERVVQRFYVDERLRHQKMQDELRKAYIESTEPKFSRRSRDDITLIVDRLFKGSA